MEIKVSRENVYGITLLAISKFHEISRLEERLEKKRDELNIIVRQIPTKDMAYYVAKTS